MEDKIIAYKGMDSKMQCRGMQYAVGDEFAVDGKIECCGNGLHACECPLDVLGYYAPGTGARYFCVTQSGDLARERGGDSKVASRKMRVDAEIGIPGLVKAHIEYVKAHTTTEHTDSERATAGNSGAATAGNSGAATAGNSGAATAGDRGAATAGNFGAATAGDRGAATSRGRASVGENGIASVRCSNPMAKGGIGAVLVLARESEETYDLICWNSAVVDGKTIKADTWYTLDDNGNIVEAEEGAQA